ncbi:hypothetical protein BDV96DRAFT_643868 [Lophiotrema nucula]|uniref:Uncharacterized protein n=1 Tax=Lophiotrema nucula TaxID=690887 RepID=A0A6A5ZEX5_9PLEO|nr:hypothetical protein BDV96DRAFT_643868 [Lophiotrema nucula]
MKATSIILTAFAAIATVFPVTPAGGSVLSCPPRKRSVDLEFETGDGSEAAKAKYFADPADTNSDGLIGGHKRSVDLEVTSEAA